MRLEAGALSVDIRLVGSPLPLPCTAEAHYFATLIPLDAPIDPVHPADPDRREQWHVRPLPGAP